MRNSRLGARRISNLLQYYPLKHRDFYQSTVLRETTNQGGESQYQESQLVVTNDFSTVNPATKSGVTQTNFED